MQIFAIDHAASLIRTNRVFRERGFSRPPNLIRVPLDFEQGRVDEQLAACDFDGDTATFCSALGLMLYLEDEVVDDILRFVVWLSAQLDRRYTFLHCRARFSVCAYWLLADIQYIILRWKLTRRQDVKRRRKMRFANITIVAATLLCFGIAVPARASSAASTEARPFSAAGPPPS